MDQLAEIQRIRKLLASGVTTTSVDGQTVTIDREDLKRELVNLELAAGLRTRNPRVAQVVTGNR